jgi:hypothetical protein
MDLDPTGTIGVDVAVEILLEDLTHLVTSQATVRHAEQVHYPRLDHR